MAKSCHPVLYKVLGVALSCWHNFCKAFWPTPANRYAACIHSSLGNISFKMLSVLSCGCTEFLKASNSGFFFLRLFLLKNKANVGQIITYKIEYLLFM